MTTSQRLAAAIREVATERRKKMIAGWKASPPDLVIAADIPGIEFNPAKGYRRAHVIGNNVIYQRVRNAMSSAN